MRIISFNIQYRRRENAAARQHRMEQISAFLKSLKPDVICLQEVVPDGWATLVDQLQPCVMDYVPRGDGHSSGEGVPILCCTQAWSAEESMHFWFSETPEEPSRSWGAVHPRICSAMRLRKRTDETAALWIVNLHLSHNSQLARENSLKLLQRRLRSLSESGSEIMLCGDFNMPFYRRSLLDFAQNAALKNATHYHPVNLLKPTYLGWSPFRFFRARIDHCFHSSGWQVRRYQALLPDWNEDRLSDHRALVVDLSPSSS
jgi:endonuclease/exonuclease/phosphatase family metal-dependent hydrolase